MQTQKLWVQLNSFIIDSETKNIETSTLFSPVISLVQDKDSMIPFILFNDGEGDKILSAFHPIIVYNGYSVKSMFLETELQDRYKDSVIEAFNYEGPLEIGKEMNIYCDAYGISLPEVHCEYVYEDGVWALESISFQM